MDVSGTLKEIAAHLFRVRSNQIKIQIIGPNPTNFGFRNCVLEVETTSGRFVGGGSSTNTMNAFLKAVAEAGESILMHRLKLKSRNGLAGGLLSCAAIVRAKYELLERDSFLYHYRNRQPFLISRLAAGSSLENVRLFSLRSKDVNVKVSLATTNECVEGHSDCLVFGVGASRSRAHADRKAVEELASFYDFHSRQPEWCKGLRPDTANSADIHHLYSRDRRNIELFKSLCLADAGELDEPTEINWRIEMLNSPVRYFKYCLVQSEMLSRMEFGVPENDSDSDPIYHPFW